MQNWLPKSIFFLLGWLLLSGEFLAQAAPPPAVFSGIITMIDLERKEFAVRNKDGELLFRLSGESIINGSAAGEGSLRAGSLKEGMIVTVSYTEKDGDKIASRIDAKTSSVGTSKGWEYPFGCGLSVC